MASQVSGELPGAAMSSFRLFARHHDWGRLRVATALRVGFLRGCPKRDDRQLTPIKGDPGSDRCVVIKDPVGACMALS